MSSKTTGVDMLFNTSLTTVTAGGRPPLPTWLVELDSGFARLNFGLEAWFNPGSKVTGLSSLGYGHGPPIRPGSLSLVKANRPARFRAYW
ncbi:hypothetical protein V6N13_087890 [Hibiscus sabdariffa]|uniref:Uncharacterized protein n=1 Tax=Hibiscus sabdariffa TaxID=183260 RepID=A0ABR2FXM2_9ROSI